MKDGLQTAFFAQAINGAKETVSALEKLDSAIAHNGITNSEAGTAERALQECQNQIKDLLTRLAITEGQSLTLIAVGRDLIREGRRPELVADRWAQICAAKSSQSNIAALLGAWKRKRRLEQTIDTIDSESAEVRYQVEKSRGLENVLSVKESINRRIDDQRAPRASGTR